MLHVINRGNPLAHRFFSNIYHGVGVDTCSLYNIKKDIRKIMTLRLEDGDLCITPDPFVTLVLLLVNWSTRSQILYFSFEMYGHTKPSNSVKNVLINTVWCILQYTTLRLVPYVVFSNELRKEYYERNYPFLKGKTFVCENYCLTKNLPKSSEKNYATLNEILKRKKIWVGYVGSIQSGRSVQTFIDSFEKASPSNVGLIIAGKDEMGIASYIHSKNNSSIFYVGHLTFEETVFLFERLHYGLMHYSNDFLNTRYCAPLKIYEYIAYRIKIICNCNESMLGKHNLIDYYYKDEEELEEIFENLFPPVKETTKSDQYEFVSHFNNLLDEVISQ